MSHLPEERLVALIDESPTSAELAHLASCELCARQRAAYKNLSALATAEQARIGNPLTDWESLAPTLREDGIIDTGEWRVTRRTRRGGRVWLQVAAAVLLVMGGVAAGRMLAIGGDEVPGPRTIAALASDSALSFRSVSEARAARTNAELVYQSAALYLARYDSTEYSPDTPAAIRHRLATLDQVGETVREALTESPYDPVINGYYLTTLGQREATLRQLNASLPPGARPNSF